MLRRKKGHEKGFILAVVIMAVILMFVVVIGVLSRNTSRAISSNSDLKRIQAELVTKSAMWKANESLRTTGSLPATYTEGPYNGVTYTVTFVLTPNLNGTTGYRIAVSY